jgi:hypothetical protein
LRPDLDGIWSFELRVLAEDDDGLGAYDGVFGSVSRGRRERRSWRLYGGVLKGRGCVTGEVIAGCYWLERERRGIRGGDEADRWGPPGSEGERGRRVPVRNFPGWAVGCFGVGPESFPEAFFHFYFYFSSFSFFCFLFLS